MAVLHYIAYALGGMGLLGTLLALVPSGKPIFRIWDFPRSQLAAALAIAIAVEAASFNARSPVGALYLAALAGGLLWQALRILPYTPAFRTQVARVQACDAGRTLRLMASNVLIENRDASRLLKLVAETRPDVLLLLETDAWWDAALSDLRRDYPFSVRQPQDNSYGLHLYSTLELVDPEVRFLVDEEIPSVKTGLRLPSGDLVRLYGVHPQPPPFVDTEERDAELLIVAKEVAATDEPAIVAGDLNDVAWSRSTHRFQRVSGLLDPRVGRGLYNTFDASKPWFMRWPLDHVFFSPAFRLLDVRVLTEVGSDHFPFFVSLCYAPEATSTAEVPEAEAEDVREADTTIRTGIQKAATS